VRRPEGRPAVGPRALGAAHSTAREARCECGDILVRLHDDASLQHPQLHDFGIGRAPSDSPDCASIVAGRGEYLGVRAGDVLVDEEVHRGTG